jgi:cysteinyl-tRNA synthetase
LTEEYRLRTDEVVRSFQAGTLQVPDMPRPDLDYLPRHLVLERKRLRRAHHWEAADGVRDLLTLLGYRVSDASDGQTTVRRDGYGWVWHV